MLVVVVLAAALASVAGDGDLLNTGGVPALREFFAAALHPRVDRAFLQVVGDAALTTLAYAVLGTVLSIALGLVGGVLVSQTWWRASGALPRTWVSRWLATRALMAVPRGVHEVVWGLVLLSVLGLDPLVAVLAIGLPFGAVCSKVFSEILDETPRAPFEALRASGAGRLAALLYGLAPLALPDLLSYSAYRFECAIRSAAILGIVGAGGLGFQLALSFQSLRYDEIWTLLAALVVLCGATDGWSSAVRRRCTGSRARPERDRVLGWLIVAAVALVPVSVVLLRLDPTVLVQDRARDLTVTLAQQAWPPEADWGVLVSLSLDTLMMSVIAAALSFAGAVLLAVLAARPADDGRTVARRVLGWCTRQALLFFRAVPSPVWALLVLFVWFPGPLAGALALALYNVGILGRLMAEAVEDLDRRPQRALLAAGVSPARAFLYAGLPTVWHRFVAYGMYRWEVIVRETVVVGVVGAGGLGRLLAEQTASFHYAGASATLLALIALTFLVDLTSAAVRRSGSARLSSRAVRSRSERAPGYRRSPRTL
ncbi:MAG: ABC transporter permease subunit [Propionibacteriales bacterium]|nr:ABC transporter permease subunit [Propionibacteriales bacterium]